MKFIIIPSPFPSLVLREEIACLIRDLGNGIHFLAREKFETSVDVDASQASEHKIIDILKLYCDAGGKKFKLEASISEAIHSSECLWIDGSQVADYHVLDEFMFLLGNAFFARPESGSCMIVLILHPFHEEEAFDLVHRAFYIQSELVYSWTMCSKRARRLLRSRTWVHKFKKMLRLRKRKNRGRK